MLEFPPPRERRTGRAGVRDVARLAGVSPITVSRALATPDVVSPATRARVEAAIAATGYIPNRIAASLSSNRTRMIGAVVPTLENSIPADFIAGMSEVLHARGYQLLLGNAGFSVAKEERLIVEFLARRADGLYLTGTTHSPRIRELLRRTGLPTVEIAALPEDPIDMVVGFSNDGAAHAMTRHLARRGYRHVAFFSPPTSDNERQTQRLAGYRRAVREHGLTDDPRLIAEMPIDLGSAASELRALLDRYPAADAVFCASDILAAGVLFECQRLGLPVPDRLAVAGFEDYDIARHIHPALTTVRIPRHEIGVRAAEMLLDRIGGKPVRPEVVDLGFRIVQRETT